MSQAKSVAPSRVTVFVGADDIRAVNGAGAQLRLAVLPSPLGFNPLELQSAALGICTAITLRNELRRQAGVALDAPFELVVQGAKAPDAPSRLARLDITVRFAPPLRELADAALLERAEAACTIGNTLRGDPQIGITLAPSEAEG